MGQLHWFIRTLKKTFNIEVLQDAVRDEAFDFSHEDLEYLHIPPEHLEFLPDPLIFKTLTFVDKNDDEWMAGIVEEKQKIVYEVWIKNGEPLAYEIYV